MGEFADGLSDARIPRRQTDRNSSARGESSGQARGMTMAPTTWASMSRDLARAWPVFASSEKAPSGFSASSRLSMPAANIGKHALVTGASSDIGAAIVRELATLASIWC